MIPLNVRLAYICKYTFELCCYFHHEHSMLMKARNFELGLKKEQ